MDTLPKKTSSLQVNLLLAIICLLILPALCFYPFHTDHSIQQAMALSLVRYHGLPYIGSWDHNFPGTILIHSAGILLFGNSMLGFRMMELLMQIAIVLSLYKLSRLWLSEGAALIGCALYAIYYIHGPGQFLGQRDDFAVLPLAWGFWCSVKAYRNPKSTKLFLFLSGLFLALACFIRPTLGVLIFVPFFTLFDIRERRARTLFIFELIGFFLIVLLWALPYFFIQDGVRQVYLSVIRFNTDIYSDAPFHWHDISNRSFLVVAFLLWWAVAMLLHRKSGRHLTGAPHSKNEKTFVIASFVALLFAAVIMRRIASYHLMPFCAFFMPVLGAALWNMKLRWKKWGSPAVISLVIVLLLSLYPWKIIISPQGKEILFSNKPLFERMIGSPQDSAAIAYVMTRTAPSDPAEVSSFFPDIRWQIERPEATRFTTLTGILLRRIDKKIPDFQQEWRAEYVHNMERVQPKFYIIQNAVDSSEDIMTQRDLLALPGFGSFISEKYALDTIVGDYYIYGRK